MSLRYLTAPFISSAIVILMSMTSAAGGSSSEAPGLLPPLNESPPSVSGTAQAGLTLVADPGNWSGPSETMTLQWQSCDASGNGCVDVAAASSPSYALGEVDVGSTLRIEAIATNKNGSTSAVSEPSGLVAAAPDPAPAVIPPSPITSPTITGTPQQGQTLTAEAGSWDGTPPLVYAYQWQRCDSSGSGCADVDGAIGQTYALASADVGATMRVSVSASNSAGSGSAISVVTSVVTSSPTPQAPAPQCSTSSLGSCPASYFVGPLGANNLIPAKPGAFLIDLYGGQGTTWAQVQAGVLQRQQDMGRKFDGVGQHYDGSGTWGGVFGMDDPAGYSPRPEQWIHDNGSFPLISWTPNYTITQMNNGAADAIWAKAANYWKTYPFRIMLRTFSEFDGPFLIYAAVPWSGNGYVDSCGAPFIAAWQRMVNIFKANGATNVGFFWNPEEGVTRSCIKISYPGDTYVDWVGSDWYNTCLVVDSNYCTPTHPGWAQFWELFDYNRNGGVCCTQHDQWGPHKPFVIGETGSWYDPTYPSYKGDWFRKIPADAQQMEYLRGIDFYDSDPSSVENALNNFRVDYPTSNPDVYAGFKQMAADPWFNTR
jgi:hypothetical protein